MSYCKFNSEDEICKLTGKDTSNYLVCDCACEDCPDYQKYLEEIAAKADK